MFVDVYIPVSNIQVFSLGFSKGTEQVEWVCVCTCACVYNLLAWFTGCSPDRKVQDEVVAPVHQVRCLNSPSLVLEFQGFLEGCWSSFCVGILKKWVKKCLRNRVDTLPTRVRTSRRKAKSSFFHVLLYGLPPPVGVTQSRVALPTSMILSRKSLTGVPRWLGFSGLWLESSWQPGLTITSGSLLLSILTSCPPSLPPFILDNSHSGRGEGLCLFLPLL